MRFTTKLITAIFMLIIDLCPLHLSGQSLDEIESKEEAIERLTSQMQRSNDDNTRYLVHKDFYHIYINDDTDKALESALQALRYAQLAKNDSTIVSSFLYLGNAYLKQAQFEMALENFSLGLQYLQKGDLTSNSDFVNFHLGVTYTELFMLETAEELLKKAESGFEDQKDRSLATYELIQVFLLRGDTTSALEHLDRFEGMIPIGNDLVDTDYLFHYAVLSEVYVSLGMFDKANELLKQTLPYIQKHNRRYYRGIVNIALARIAEHQDELDKAIDHAQTALTFFEQQKENFYTIKSLALLVDLHYLKENYEQAFEYLARYDARRDALLKARQSAIQNRLTDQINETARAEFELEVAEDRLKERQVYFTIVFILFLISLFLVIGTYRLMRLRDRSSKEIVRINGDKDHFIGVVSHDLRSPLSSIMALSSLMIEDPDSSEEIKEYSSIILNSSKRMESLINNMLDANKIETGGTRLQLTSVSVQNAIIEIAESITFLGEEKDIKTLIDIEENLPDILANYEAVQRVLENLISNAYKFSPKESTVFITATLEGNQVQIAIKDQGPGMSELDRSKLFTKFEKLSASPTGNEKSTGLGLFIVKNLMAEMNGTILVESEMGKGTIFKILFNKA